MKQKVLLLWQWKHRNEPKWNFSFKSTIITFTMIIQTLNIILWIPTGIVRRLYQLPRIKLWISSPGNFSKKFQENAGSTFPLTKLNKRFNGHRYLRHNNMTSKKLVERFITNHCIFDEQVKVDIMKKYPEYTDHGKKARGWLRLQITNFSTWANEQNYMRVQQDLY